MANDPEVTKLLNAAREFQEDWELNEVQAAALKRFIEQDKLPSSPKLPEHSTNNNNC